MNPSGKYRFTLIISEFSFLPNVFSICLFFGNTTNKEIHLNVDLYLFANKECLSLQKNVVIINK